MKESCERIASVLGINPNPQQDSSFTVDNLRSPTSYGSPQKRSGMTTSNNYYENSFGAATPSTQIPSKTQTATHFATVSF